MSVRKATAAMLAKDWAAHPVLSVVEVEATERGLDEVRKPTALLRHASFKTHAAAPQSHRDVGLLLTLISPHLDLDRAGDQLDEIVPAALDYLDTRFRHEGATAVAYAQRLAFDIPLTVIAQKG